MSAGAMPDRTGAVPALSGRRTVSGGPDEVARSAAERIALLSERAVRDHGWFAIALAGGDTPRLTYERLASEPLRSRIEWRSWRVFFSDERAVPEGDAASNARMAREALLDHVPVPRQSVHPMPGERTDLDAAAADYARLLESSLRRGGDGTPRCDCVLLGVGENGHTASLFPGTPALEVTDTWVTRGRADYAPFDRLTFTFPMINAAEYVLMLVTGAAKAEAIRAIAEGRAPAARVRPVEGSLLWYLDQPAARLL
jgi:6-phosphogluconolactonase